MPLLVFDTKGVPTTRHERIEAAVEAGGKQLKDSYEAWITTDPLLGGVRVLLTGPLGFERAVQFALDEDPSEITNRVRLTWKSRGTFQQEIAAVEFWLTIDAAFSSSEVR